MINFFVFYSFCILLLTLLLSCHHVVTFIPRQFIKINHGNFHFSSNTGTSFPGLPRVKKLNEFNYQSHNADLFISNDTPKQVISFCKLWKSFMQGTSDEIITNYSSIRLETPLFTTFHDFHDRMKGFINFIRQPNFTVFKYHKSDVVNDFRGFDFFIEYQWSFYYPNPWNSRIICPGTMIISLNDKGTIESVKDDWKFSIFELFQKQYIPRFWDIWHIFSSPCPEYPPMKQIKQLGNVEILEIQSSLVCDVSWSGLYKYPGPPLSVIPSFSLFGNLKTSKPNRDEFYAVLPVDIYTSKYFDSMKNESMKKTTWSFVVPSTLNDFVLENKVLNQINNFSSSEVDDDELIENEDPSIKPDYVIGLENANIMKSIRNGYQRGVDIEFDEQLIDEFRNFESCTVQYRFRPSKLVASIDIQGELDSSKISENLKKLKVTLNSQNEYSIKKAVSDSINLQLNNIKLCFNKNAEPAMAIYEMQYSYSKTRLLIEVESH